MNVNEMASMGGKARAASLTAEERSAIAAQGGKVAKQRRERRKKVRETIRWKDRLCLLGMTIVGSIEEAPRLGDWFAWACDIDWNDIDLGRHNTRRAAKAAVESWVKARM